MNWLVFTLTCVETNVVSIERIAEYIDTESEVSVCYVQQQQKTQTHLYYSLCNNISVGIQITNDQWSGPP